MEKSGIKGIYSNSPKTKEWLQSSWSTSSETRDRYDFFRVRTKVKNNRNGSRDQNGKRSRIGHTSLHLVQHFIFGTFLRIHTARQSGVSSVGNLFTLLGMLRIDLCNVQVVKIFSLMKVQLSSQCICWQGCDVTNCCQNQRLKELFCQRILMQRSIV